MRPRLLVVVALAFGPAASVAQDVEMLGDRYGTEPPAAYYQALSGDPGAFRFAHGRPARMRAQMAAVGNTGPGPLRILGPREGPVTGTYRIPVVTGLFADSPEGADLAHSITEVQAAYFGANPGTITDFYSEISGGRVTLEGDVQDWTKASFTRAQATGGNSGLSSGTTGAFILQLVIRLKDVDWGLYDNDGPDGTPNSGDDDGFVDALAVIHPTAGAECGGLDKDDRIWSHRWSLRFAAGQAFTTTVPAASGGFITIDDYLIQPLFACNETELSEIGVFSHELGHAFGLPDLYDTRDNIDGKHAGAGNWDLMSSGSWGCDGDTPARPCHMGAWSKSILGWVDIVTAPAGIDIGTVTLNPVETGGQVYRVDAGDDSGEYFLLENRQRLGYDENLFGEGLLVWHIDPDWVAQKWGGNNVNAFSHRGVWLRQADGRDDLGKPGSGRGDDDDPFPWIGNTRENRVFHAASRPAATSLAGTPTGLTLVDIATSGDDVSFRLLTRFSQMSMRADGSDPGSSVFTVDGSPVASSSHVFTSAPFVKHRFQAVPGEELSQGIRRPFVSWDDDATATADRMIETPLQDAEYVARYAGRQAQLDLGLLGGVEGVEPGLFQTQPASEDLWFEEGETVSVEAVATTGFGFLEWTGALAGQPNPATVGMAAPVSGGARFELTYAVPTTPVSFPAATTLDLRLEAVDGTAPVVWVVTEGVLPEGVAMDPFGHITGAALDLGAFPIQVRATDARGLQATGQLVLDVAGPGIPVDQLASFFLGVGAPLNALQVSFLDRQGNQSGGYDLGDLRAWVLANPALPFTARQRGILGVGTIVVLTKPSVREGGR
jgi:M6 family metalloprotease-like protein